MMSRVWEVSSLVSRVEGVGAGEYQAEAVMGRTTSTITDRLLASPVGNIVKKYLEMHSAD